MVILEAFLATLPKASAAKISRTGREQKQWSGEVVRNRAQFGSENGSENEWKTEGRRSYADLPE